MPTAYVRAPNGQVYEGPEENMARFQAMVPGAQVLSEQEAQAELGKAQLRAEESGLTGAAKQFVSSAIEGGTMLPIAQGIERKAARLFAKPGEEDAAEQEAIERLRVREQEQQAAALAGQAVGFGGAALLTGGAAPEAGLLARGARALTAPARGVMAVGTKAAEKAGARFAEDSLKRAVAGAVARGAAEGAALGAGQLAKDLTLGEDITPELVTERLVGGALFGAGGGALFEGLGAAATKAATSLGTESVGMMLGAGVGGYMGGIPGAVAGGAAGKTFGRYLGRTAAAGERATIADILERERAEAGKTSGKIVQRDLDATERRALFDAEEAEANAAAAPREEELAGGLDSAEAELQRGRQEQLNRQRRENYEAADAMAPQVEELLARFKDSESGLAAEARRKLATATKDVEEIASSFGNYREGLMAKAMRGYQSAYEGITGAAKRAKVSEFARGLGEADAAAYASAARETVVRDLTAFADELEANVKELPGLRAPYSKQVKQIREAAQKIEATASLADQRAALAEIHNIGDKAKREFDRQIARGAGGAATLAEGDFVRGLRTSNGLDAVRQALQAPELFGEEIAALQTELNRAWRKSIPELLDTQKRYMREGLDPNEIDPFKLDQIVDPAKLIPAIKGIGSEEQAANLDALRRFIDSQERLQRVAAERFNLRPAERERVVASLEALGKMRTELERAVEASRMQQAAKLISEDAMEQLKIGAAAKIPGIGQALTALLDLERRATMERALSGLVGDADRRINDAAKAFIRGAERPGRFVVEAARGAAEEASTKPAPQIKPKEAVAKELATAAPRETREKMAAEALRQIATVTAVAGTPGALDRFAFAGTGPMQFTSDPRLATTVANASARAFAYLYTKRPPTFESDTLQPGLVARQLSDGQLAQWRAYVTTAAKPLTVLDDLARGTVRKEQVETLRALYPALYSSIQSKLLDELHSTRAQISFAQRVLLFQLFGSATDPSLKPQNIAAIQASYKPAQPAPSGASRATPGRVRGSFAADVRTSTESLAARGNLP